MAKDTITQLLEKVAAGKLSVKDARTALEDASLTEEQMDAAINHGVFNPAEPGTIISASLAPSGNSALTIFFFSWGIFWALYWFGTMLYGLLNGSSMGPTTTFLPHGNGNYNSNHDGNRLPEIRVA